MNSNQMNFYNPYGEQIANIQQEHASPLKVAFITSVRDVGAYDMNGQNIQLPQAGNVYMEGLIEAILRNDRNDISECMKVVGVINDDTEKDFGKGKLNGYSLQPNSGLWIHPQDLRNSDGEKIANLTTNIPSNFRSLPLKDIDERRFRKEEFEKQVLQIMHDMGADILISDHLMLRAEFLVQELREKFLNIHPAITNISNPNSLRGPVPTQDALDRANGFLKNHENNTSNIIQPYFKTGATFHIINQDIDDGPLLCDHEITQVNANDTPQELRFRNYQSAKIPVFLAGMRHYFENVFPHVNSQKCTIR